MYSDYFGFREKPFSLTPDPRFFYTNPVYQEAYANLVYGIRERKGFVMLTGEIGTGKTTLLRRLMANLEASVQVVFFTHTTLTFEELLSFICEELDLPAKGAGRLIQLRALNQFLMEQAAKRGTVALLIDEAQNLGDEVLENLRLLSNLETTGDKLLQIVLVGQPELGIKLDQAKLRQVKQRLAIRCQLHQLASEEIGPFINYRLDAVGYKGQQLFTPGAIRDIAVFSRGFPRLINMLCDSALLMAYATSRTRVTAALIREAAADLRLASSSEKDTTADTDLRRGSSGSTTAKRPATFRVKQQPFWRQGIRQTQLAIWALVVLVILSVSGMGVYAWRATSLEAFDIGLSAWPHTLQKTLSGWLVRHDPHVSSQGQLQKPMLQLPSTSLTEEVSPASPVDLPTTEGGTAGRDSRTESIAARGARGENSLPATPPPLRKWLTTGGPTDPSTWREHPIVIQPGATVAEIAMHTYGEQHTLGLDLMHEFNTHIADLNRIVPGQKLWLPSLTRDTLIRRRTDNSYAIVLASFLRRQQAVQFAELGRLQGYEAVVTPRKVSDQRPLYRVEIRGLKNRQEVDEAWETALIKGWITLRDEPSGRRF